MWLEINKNKTIIAKHSHQFDSENELWFVADGMAEIGDQWENGTVLARENDPSGSELLNRSKIKNKVQKQVREKISRY